MPWFRTSEQESKMRTLEDLLHLEPAAQFLGGGCTERGFRSNSVTARMLICSRGAQMFSHTHPRPAPKSLLPSLRTKSLFLEKSVCVRARPSHHTAVSLGISILKARQSLQSCSMCQRYPHLSTGRTLPPLSYRLYGPVQSLSEVLL